MSPLLLYEKVIQMLLKSPYQEYPLPRQALVGRTDHGHSSCRRFLDVLHPSRYRHHAHASSSTSGDHILENVRQGTVLVQFDRVFSDLPGPKIVNDNFHGAYEGTHHLIEQGYKRIGHIAGFRDTEAYMDRLNGYKLALTDMGIEIDEDIIFYDSIVEESGYKAGKIALERGCDAIYCAGDFSALGAYIAVKESGVRIPDDFGIIGTANEFFTTIMSPSISSIAQHPYEIGRRAAQAFLTSLKPGANVGKIVVAMEIKARESSLRKTGR